MKIKKIVYRLKEEYYRKEYEIRENNYYSDDYSLIRDEVNQFLKMNTILNDESTLKQSDRHKYLKKIRLLEYDDFMIVNSR